MAPGRTVQRLLASSATTTSARLLLALVVAALVLGGCGGGSSDSSNSASTAVDASSSSGAGDSDSAKGSHRAGAGAGAEAEGPAAGSAAPQSALAVQGSTGDGSKQGSRIAQPEGAPEPGITPQQRREATVASMTLTSPSSQASSAGPQTLPATYTCDGKGTSPALHWQGVPQGAAELVLFAMNVQPVEGKLFFDWAVAGLSPELEEIGAGKLPESAIVGRNGFGKRGYEICPEGGGETYVFTVFALPKKLSPASGFDPSALRREVLGSSGNVGLLALSYTRG
jgi:phosphatidylethanolamine-binding protein (PEBP) family uncharacterized protein